MRIATLGQAVAMMLATSTLRAGSAMAQALPTVAQPNGAAQGDFLTVLDTLGQDVIDIVLFIVAAVAFIVVAYYAVVKFREAIVGRAEWGEVALTGLFGAGILVFVTILMSAVDGIF